MQTDIRTKRMIYTDELSGRVETIRDLVLCTGTLEKLTHPIRTMKNAHELHRLTRISDYIDAHSNVADQEEAKLLSKFIDQNPIDKHQKVIR